MNKPVGQFRNSLLCFLYLSCGIIYSQSATSGQIPSNSVFINLKMHDSLIFYQCHVESAIEQLSTTSGQTITGSTQRVTITEKYILSKQEGGYLVSYFTSSLHVFPNKKFTGLKFKEKPYWDFKAVKSFILQEADLKPFLAMEQKGRDAVVYDYPVTKYTTNQIIIRYPDDYKQLVIDGPYVLSKLLNIQK